MPARPKKNHRSQKTNGYGKKDGSFRIIGGSWRSRRLSFPVIEGLRPTTDRVKETVFNWLMPYIERAIVLDLFAGSGSLGIEALSRGAKSLTAVEVNRSAAQSIKTNLELLLGSEVLTGSEILNASEMPTDTDTQKAKVCHTNALAWLDEAASGKTNEQLFDVVFLDPPFRKDLLNTCIEHITQKPILKNKAIIYLEREKEATDIVIPVSWKLLKEKIAGQVCYQLYEVSQ